MNPSSTQLRRADRLADLFAPAMVDIFAGGGGWSIGTEQALVEAGYRDRYIDLMINHWDVAVGVHRVNHPMTEHLQASVFEVDPREVLPGRRIAYLHLSPDCTHHSRARGSKPKKKEIRALAWVGIRWAYWRRPDVITLENVAEFADWGPLDETGEACRRRKGQSFGAWVSWLRRLGYEVEWRELSACDYGAPTTRKRLFVIARCDGKPIIWPEKTHGSTATDRAPQQHPRQPEQDDRGNNSETLRDHQRPSDWSHYEDGTGAAGHGSRKRQGRSLAQVRQRRHPLKPYRTAAECIDWSIPMLSIFATPEQAKAWARQINQGRPKHERIGTPRRPLKEKTLRRIAGGLVKYVIEAKRPYLVNIQNYGWDTSPVRSVDEPLSTITSSPKGGAYAVADVAVAPYSVPRYGERDGQAPRCGSVDQPSPTIVGTGNGAQLVAAMLSKHYGGVIGKAIDQPADTVTGVDHHSLTCAHLMKFRGSSVGTAADEPCPTITSGAGAARDAGAAHALGVSCCYLSHMYTSNTSGGQGDPRKPAKTVTGGGQHASLVAAFLAAYYGEGSGLIGHSPADPSPTVTGRDRFGLVTVAIDGETYVITDIAMRMLTPRELARCQGFDDDYVIDRTADGQRVTKADQVKLVGNSVCPPIARAIVRENVVRQGVLDHSQPAAMAKGVA